MVALDLAIICMRERIKLIVQKYHRTTIGQMVIFGSIGVINTTLDLCIYYSLTRFTDVFRGQVVTAKSLSFIVASAFSFLFNRRFTFGRRDKIRFMEVVKFYSTVGAGIFINVGAVYVLHVWLHIFDLIAVLMSTVLTFVWGFTFSKKWVFKDQKLEIKN